jgi:hypothetical protein
MLRRTNIIMLDDELISKSRGTNRDHGKLATWLRWFDKGQQKKEFKLLAAPDLKSFREHLQSCANENIQDPNYIDAILIDIIWEENSKSDKDFGEMGFPNVVIKPKEAGAQLLSLMLNRRYKSEREPWLITYEKRRKAMFSTLNGSEIASAYLDTTVIDNNLCFMSKNTETKRGKEAWDESIVQPDETFVKWAYKIREDSIKEIEKDRLI